MSVARPFGDERGGVERVVIWVVALAVVAATVGSVVYLAEDVRRNAPESDFDVSFDQDTATVTVEYAGGEPITDRVTDRLAVEVVDASAGTRSEVVWASDAAGPTNRGTGYPVSQGDTLTIDDPSVDADGDENVLDAEASVGFTLEAGDTIRVVWTGNRQGGTAQNETLANETLG